MRGDNKKGDNSSFLLKDLRNNIEKLISSMQMTNEGIRQFYMKNNLNLFSSVWKENEDRIKKKCGKVINIFSIN